MRPSRALLAAAATAATLGLSLSSSVAGARVPAGALKLSNERTLTRWANPVMHGRLRVRPNRDARIIARLDVFTEDGFPNVYLVLRRWSEPRTGKTWYQVRIPGRPNGKVGWVREERLGPLQTSRTRVVVDRRRLRATLYRDGRRVFRAPVGVGKPSTPTPRGHFWIREKLVLRGGHGLYGPLAFGTSAYSRLSDWPRGGVVGIHGTDQPRLVPGRPSHGCIRMRNRDVLRLARLLGGRAVGTPVLIR